MGVLRRNIEGFFGTMARVLILAVLLACAAGIIFQVPANQQVCFGEELGYDMVVHGVYKTVAGRDASLKVEVFQTTLVDDVATGPVKLVTKTALDGSFGFTTEKQGEIRFCFQSEADNYEQELEIDFDLKVGFEAKDYAEVAKKEHLKPVEVDLVKLIDMAVEMQREMTTIHQREESHRVTTDNANSAVVCWSSLSLVIITVLGIYQTYWLRSYFRKKRLI